MRTIVFLIGYESLLIPTMLQKIGFIEMWLRTRNPLYTLAPEILISAIALRYRTGIVVIQDQFQIICTVLDCYWVPIGNSGGGNQRKNNWVSELHKESALLTQDHLRLQQTRDNCAKRLFGFRVRGGSFSDPIYNGLMEVGTDHYPLRNSFVVLLYSFVL